MHAPFDTDWFPRTTVSVPVHLLHSLHSVLQTLSQFSSFYVCVHHLPSVFALRSFWLSTLFSSRVCILSLMPRLEIFCCRCFPTSSIATLTVGLFSPSPFQSAFPVWIVFSKGGFMVRFRSTISLLVLAVPTG